MKKLEPSTAIFWHKFLKAIADSIIKLFIPLYILKVTNDIRLSISYLSIYSLFVLFFMFILKKFIQKYGVLAIILHFLPIVATQSILSFCEINIWIIIACAGLMALTQALYSIPLNLIFSLLDKKTNVAKFQVATNIGKLVFTLLSGFLLSSEIKNSFLWLSIASSIVYVLCVIPILSAYKPLKEKYEMVSCEKPKTFSERKIFSIFHISFGCFQTTMDNVVPLFLYINNLSFKSVTILLALIELIKIGVNYFAKFLVGKHLEKVSCYSCAVIYLLSVIGIIFIKNSVILYTLSVLCSICFPLTFVPMFKNFCNKINAEDCTITETTKRDFDIFSLRPAYYGSYFLGIDFYGCFALAIASIIVMVFAENKILTPKQIEPTKNLTIDANAISEK